MSGRNAQGQGTMTQLASGAWRFQVMVNGKRHGETFTYPNKRAAAAALPLWVAKVRTSGPVVSGSSTTVAAMLDVWLGAKRGAIEDTTHYEYESLVRHLRARIGDMPLGKVTPATIDDVLASVRATAGQSTANHLHVVGKQAFAFAVSRDLIAANPFASVPRPRRPKPTIVPPTPAQVGSLISHATGDMRAFLTLAIASGARKGELLALRFGDVDTSGDLARITIRATVVNVPGVGASVKERTKGGKVRVVTLDPGTSAMLKAHRADVTRRTLAVGVPLIADSFIFPGNLEARAPLALTTHDHEWRRVCRRAKVRGVRLHDLRHFHATQALANGVDVKTLSNRLGHASAAMTLDRYAAFLPAADEAAARTFGGIMRAVLNG